MGSYFKYYLFLTFDEYKVSLNEPNSLKGFSKKERVQPLISVGFIKLQLTNFDNNATKIKNNFW